MKKIYFLCTVLMCVGLLNAQAPPEIIHYNFNNTGSLVPNFASSPPPGSGTGTIIAGVQQGISTGQCQSALSGSGTTGTDHIETGWTFTLSGSWSIAFWTNSITPSTTLWYIFGESSTGFRCFTNGVAGANNWILRATNMTDMLITNGALTTAVHNCFVYDAANSQGRMYLNGVYQGSVTQTPTSFSGGTFKVGQYASSNNLNGLMDEFRFYSRALTNSEVAQIATGQPVNNTVTITSCGPYTSPSTASVYPNSGVYTETFTSCGGTSTNNINLTVTPAPSVSIAASNTNICSGTTVTLTANGTATSYTWNNTGPSTTQFTATPGATSVYTLVGAGGSCNVTRTISIQVAASPTLQVNSSGTSPCYGSPVSITVTGAPSYSWSTGATSNTLTQTPLTNTVYNVMGINGTCTTTAIIPITVVPVPTVVVSPVTTTICSGSTATLTASGANVFAWSTSNTGSAIVVGPLTSTTYTVIGITSNCSDTKTVMVQVNPTPSVSVLSSSSTVCSGSMVTLTASGAGSYSWSSGGTANPNTVTPVGTTVYTVTGTTAGCSKNAVVNVFTIPLPTINVNATSSVVCSGSVISLSAFGANSFTWQNNTAGPVFTASPSSNTVYVVTGIGQNGCMGQKSYSVTVSATPTITASSNRPVSCKGESVTITALGAGSYAWSTSTNTTAVLTQVLSNNRTYTITGANADGCKHTITLTQTVLACTSINENNNNDGIRIFPNPTQGEIHISSGNYDRGLLQVYNTSGQLMQEESLVNGEITIDLRKFSAGIYYLTLTSGTETNIFKVVKE